MANGIFPTSRTERVEFLKVRLPGWLTNAVALGSSSTVITNLTNLNDAAIAARDAQVLALGQAKAATEAFYNAVKAMDNAASDVVKQIRLKAATGGGDAVYELAVLPAPAKPTPKPAPGTPTNFSATLRPDGTLALAWDCANPAGAQGTMYQIARRVGASGPFTAVGNSGKKAYTDTTVPAGVACLTYQITAARSTASGTPAQFLVNLGCDEGTGQAVAKVAA